MPALGGFNPRSSFGEFRGQKPKVPQIFFTLTEDEIVKVMVDQGYSEGTATKEAAKFMKYRERIAGPTQVWTEAHCVEHADFRPSCDRCQAASERADGNESPQHEEVVTKGFADEMAGRRGE